jgi:hypothetical protein
MKENQLNPIEVLEKLDIFYNNAWDKLIIYNAILLTIIGVIIPFIIQWWQNRNLKIKEDSLKKELNDLFVAKFKEFNEQIIKAVDEKFQLEVDDIKKYQDNIKAGLEGSHFHLQANSETESKDKMKSLIWAAQNYIKGGDFLNLIPVLEMIVTNIPKLNKEDISEIYVEDADLEALIKTLDETENNNTYLHLIRKIKILYSKIPSESEKK